MTTSEEYNYAVFPPDDDVTFFARFAEHLKVGEAAPGFAATLLDGRQTRLSEYTARGMVVIELGSFT